MTNLRSLYYALIACLGLAGACEAQAKDADLAAAIGRLDALLRAPVRKTEDAARDFVRQTVAVDRLVETTFGKYLEDSLDDYDDISRKSASAAWSPTTTSAWSRLTASAWSRTWPTGSRSRRCAGCAWNISS